MVAVTAQDGEQEEAEQTKVGESRRERGFLIRDHGSGRWWTW